MSEQTALPGFDAGMSVGGAVSLTERQAQALAIVRERGPITSEDLGEAVRLERGGRASGAEFDASNGNALGNVLKAKGLCRLVVHEGRRVWVPNEWIDQGGRRHDGYDPATAPLPEGF